MVTLRMLVRPRAERTEPSHPVPPHDEPNAGLLEGELLDLYVAILIVVPLALFLKSLWS
jgi:hypothetical protein